MPLPLILRQVLGSEKFVYVSLLFMIPLTVFAFMGKVSIDAWRHDALWAVGFLVGGKTIQGAAENIGGRRAADTPPARAHKAKETPEPPPLPPSA